MSRRLRPVAYRGTTTLITGASSGLGAEFATQLARRGADVVLVARRKHRLAELAEQLSATHGVHTTVVEADLSTPRAASSLTAQLADRGLQVDSLVNSAGFGMSGDLVTAEPQQLHDMIAVNVATLTDLTRALLPQLMRSGRGVLINIASTAAYQPTPRMAAYAASKADVLSLTEAIGHEAKSSGLRVLALSPGPTRTEFFDVVGTEDAAVGRFQTPAQVVRTALHELDTSHPRPSVVSGRLNAATATLVGALPRRLVLRAAARAMR